jgi:uncharacterized protein YndB with AHSA1/START domain
MSDTSITVSGVVDAPVERVFALLADPDRHRDLDASGMIRHSETHLAITEVGDVFTMAMHNESMGDYEIDNHVVVYEPDRAIGWAPGAHGKGPAGHTYTWYLAPTDDDHTEVSQTYDWSAIDDPGLLPYFPVVTAEQLTESIARLESALA